MALVSQSKSERDIQIQLDNYQHKKIRLDDRILHKIFKSFYPLIFNLFIELKPKYANISINRYYIERSAILFTKIILGVDKKRTGINIAFCMILGMISALYIQCKTNMLFNNMNGIYRLTNM